MTTSQTPAPQFSAPTVSGPAIAPQAYATRRDGVAEAEARLLDKFRALLREGRGTLQVTVTPGVVQFFRLQPDGRLEIG